MTLWIKNRQKNITYALDVWLNHGFFQHSRSVCSPNIFHGCCLWPNNNQLPPSLNSTNIALIPKGDDHKTMNDQKPITLCNGVYNKLLVKVLANRLKNILYKCISNNQSTFVSGLSINDNAMIPIEVVHRMKVNKRSRDKTVALKLDISKAYNRIDWLYP